MVKSEIVKDPQFMISYRLFLQMKSVEAKLSEIEAL